MEAAAGAIAAVLAGAIAAVLAGAIAGAAAVLAGAMAGAAVAAAGGVASGAGAEADSSLLPQALKASISNTAAAIDEKPKIKYYGTCEVFEVLTKTILVVV